MGGVGWQPPACNQVLGLYGEAEGAGPGQCGNKMADPEELIGGQQKGGNGVFTGEHNGMMANRQALEQEKLRLDI